MTVSDLIQQLSELDGDLPVMLTRNKHEPEAGPLEGVDVHWYDPDLDFLPRDLGPQLFGEGDDDYQARMLKLEELEEEECERRIERAVFLGPEG